MRPTEEELQEILKRSVSIYGEDKSEYGVHILNGRGVTVMARHDVPKLWEEIKALRRENARLKNIIHQKDGWDYNLSLTGSLT